MSHASKKRKKNPTELRKRLNNCNIIKIQAFKKSAFPKTTMFALFAVVIQ